MSGFDIDSLTKSKIRLCLENNILDWKKYEHWVLEQLGCSSLKEDVNEKLLKNFVSNAEQALDVYSNYDFWSEDLIPVFIWDNQLVVFGLQYNENLVKIENHIFILVKPEVLSFFSSQLFDKNKNQEDELEQLEKSYSQTISRIEGLSLDTEPPPPNLNFTDIKFDSTVTNFSTTQRKVKVSSGDENSVWDFINERHGEYCFEAKKQFNAYIVLKIDNSLNTKVFKMDEDLQKDNINEKLFEYNLNDNNAFSTVYKSGLSEVFDSEQLGLNTLGFKNICVTALKRGDKVVGFLLGLKKEKLSQMDQDLLEDLAKESA